MSDQGENRDRSQTGHWGWFFFGVLALGLIVAAILYKYTGDFTGLASFNTRGQSPATPIK
jgi:hypothetical protein